MASKHEKSPDFVEYPTLDTNIRDNPSFVALSTKKQRRVKVVGRKQAVQRRLSRVQSMQKGMNEKERDKFKDEEKMRMLNILIVKTEVCVY